MSRVRLGDVVQRVKDPVDKDNTDLIYYVGGEHFTNRAFKVTNKGLIKGSTIGPAFNTKFKSGDVLLMSRNPHLRKAGMVEFDGICSDVSYVIRTKDENVLMQRFIPLLFQTDMFWEFAEKNKKGSTNFFLNWKDFEQFEFELPEMEKQSKLVEMLWSMVDTMDSYEEIILKQDELIKSQFIEMFENKNYPQYKGKDLFKFSSGKFLPDNRRFETGIPAYGGNGIAFYTNESLVDEDTIIIGRVGAYCGNVRLARGKKWITDNALYISKYKLNVFYLDFLNVLMKLYDFHQFAGLAAQPKITQQPLEEHIYLVPPKQKQEEFIIKVNQIDKSKFEIEKSLNELKILFQKIVKEQLEN